MTTYLGEKAVGIGTIKATKAVAGDVQHDGTLVGNGNTEPLGVNKQVIATTNQVANLSATLHAEIEAKTEEIAKVRENSVKKSGDTMTGDLVFDVVNSADIIFQDSTVDTAGNTNSYRKFISAPHQTQGFIFSEIKNGVNKMQFSMLNDGLIMPSGNRLLGSAKYPWEKIYAKKLNNGADVTIPTEGGTLARVEDLESKQDKLTAGENITIENGVISATGGGGELPDNVLVNNAEQNTQNIAIYGTATGNTVGLISIGYGSKATSLYNLTDVIALGRNATAKNGESIAIGGNSGALTNRTVAIGRSAQASAEHSLALGTYATASATYCTQLGNGTNKDANTLKVANSNGNFEMMSADGTIPLERLTKVTDQIGDISTALTAILGE